MGRNFDLMAYAPRLPSKGPRRRRGKTPDLGALLTETLDNLTPILADIDDVTLVEWSAWFGEQCRFAFLRQFVEIETDQTWRIRPSGQKCARAEWYKRTGQNHDSGGTGKLGTFLAGDISEAFGMLLLRLCGVEILAEQMPVTIATPRGIPPGRGTLDSVIVLEEAAFVVDLKSTTGFGFRKKSVKDEGDLWGYRPQVQRYAMSKEVRKLVEKRGVPLAGCFLLYTNKETWRDFYAEPVPLPNLAEERAWSRHCRHVMAEKCPPRPPWAGTVIRPVKKVDQTVALQCRYCSAGGVCWEGFNYNDKDKCWERGR